MSKEKAFIKYIIFLFSCCLLFVIGFYLINFRESKISSNPSDWGVLGDYFGGVLNPLISLFTLIFLVKTYLTQKQEIQLNEVSSKEQRELLERTSKEQKDISLKTAQIQLLNTKISACYELIAVYRGEMEGTTLAMSSNRAFISIHGVEYYSDAKQIEYRNHLAVFVSTKLDEIQNYLKELD
ncbi:hypothetical protein [Pantoea agglomerans]|uniref:hypothetical protein n=1 Tax=Enterobacter agglomerans TaxID=549 RepID=UPI0015C60C71|nr:hypothetical protein [Pantoea agglomerans]NYB31532.1 hypothetical protein [Pantoea agglomerans]